MPLEKSSVRSMIGIRISENQNLRRPRGQSLNELPFSDFVGKDIIKSANRLDFPYLTPQSFYLSHDRQKVKTAVDYLITSGG